MHLCKFCIFIEIDREKECYWCILRNEELTNYSNIETCNDCVTRIVEQSNEQGYNIRDNRSAEDSGRWIRRNNLRKMWRQLNRFSKSNSRKHSDVQRVLCGWSRHNFKCYN